MIYKSIFGLLFSLPLISAFICEQNYWQVLAEVRFSKTLDANGHEIDIPVFSARLQSYHGKEIMLEGYLIPLSETGAASYMFSKLPFNVCYFCGGAGPETVVELQTSKPIDFTSKRIACRGILLLNSKDPDHHIFILQNASIVTQ